MTSIDINGNHHVGAGSLQGGRFAGRANAAPAHSLAEAAPTPLDQALSIINRPAPKGATADEKEIWASVRSNFAEQARMQPLSYLAHLANIRADSATAHAARYPAPINQTIRTYAEEFAEELNAVAGTYRHPERDPRHVGHDQRSAAEVAAEARAKATRTVSPVGLTQTRAAVRASRRSPQEIRLVTLTWESVPATSSGDPLEVTGSANGAPIILDVVSGCPTMRIVSGHAIVIDNGSGYGIEVGDGATATVISGPGRKTSITAEPGSAVDFYPSPDSRGYQTISDSAAFGMHGVTNHITLSSDR